MISRAGFALALALALALVPTQSASAERTPAARVAPGPDPVGYQRLVTSGGVVHAWYPAAPANEPTLRFRDYLPDAGTSLTAFLAGAGMDTTTIDSLLAGPLRARAAPRPLPGPFPLVLVAQGNRQDAIDQVVLCEDLASRGFVVATTPSPMLATPLEREDQVGAFAETQAKELAAAVDLVAVIVPVDRQRLGVVGHSFGARAALLLAMRDPRVRALVSLDGGIGTATASASFESAPSFRADAPLAPVLHFYEELDAFMAPDFTLLKRLRTSELTLEPTSAMHHVHFTTYGFVVERFPALAAATKAKAATPSAVRKVEQATIDFLDRRLR